MLRYVGETPFANHAWRLLSTNWYLARFQPGVACKDQRPAFCVFTWRGGDKWNIPAGMCDVSAKSAMQIFTRLTSRAADLRHTCGDCGKELQIVRPGKYQCDCGARR